MDRCWTLVGRRAGTPAGALLLLLAALFAVSATSSSVGRSSVNVDATTATVGAGVSDRLAEPVAATQISQGGASAAAAGRRGPAGDVGDRGPPGSSGKRGINGDSGPPGPTGEPGAKGQRGSDSEKGAIGPVGPDGPPGPRGPTGSRGRTGTPGAAGPPGADGPKGRAGRTGSAGAQGATGPPGGRGAPGKKGNRGEGGATGLQGERGSTGPAGNPGPTGPVGPLGPSGDAGKTGDAGEPGQTGATGERGPPGDAGQPGGPGATGSSGSTGDAGFPGATGDRGAPGPSGPTGSAGPPGATAAKGPTGPTGPAGPAGPTGPTGRTRVYVDECAAAANGGCEQLCVSGTLAAGHFCACVPGYELLPPPTDVADCAGGTVHCEHTAYGRLCACTLVGGSVRPMNGTACVDVDECVHRNGGCDQLCVNSLGGRLCSCRPGYRLVGDTHCEDVNECLDGSGDCSDGCVNLPGGYYCSCPDEMRLQNTVTTTQSCNGTVRCTHDFVEGPIVCYCVSSIDGRIRPLNGTACTARGGACRDHNGDCQQLCIDALSGGRSCACRTGYVLARDGQQCDDVNECLDHDSCAPTAQCLNTPGDYLCLDLEGVAKSAELDTSASTGDLLRRLGDDGSTATAAAIVAVSSALSLLPGLAAVVMFIRRLRQNRLAARALDVPSGARMGG